MIKKIFFYGIAVMLAFAIYYFASPSQNQKTNQVPRQTTTQASITTTNTPDSCGITTSVTEGPYYVSGARELTDGNLNYAGLPGQTITITGHVYAGLTNKPIEDAVLDIWQADAQGVYHPASNGSVTKYAPSEIALRGTVTTNSKGEYLFTTVYPNIYPGRARHIHIKIRAPDRPELTTQLILSLDGDSISFDEDTVSQGLPKCHLLTSNGKMPTKATFDFRLP